MLAVRTTKHSFVVENATVIWASSIRQTLSCLFSLLHAYLCLSESSCVRVLWVPNNAHLIALNPALIFDQSVPLTRMMHTTWLTRLVRSSTTWQRGIQTTRMSSANCWRWRSAKKSRMSRPKRPLPRCLPERGAVCAACVCACGPEFLHVRQGFLRPQSLSRGQNVALTSWKFLLQWSLTQGQKRTASTSENSCARTTILLDSQHWPATSLDQHVEAGVYSFSTSMLRETSTDMSAACTMYLSNSAFIFLSFAPFSDVLIISGVAYPAPSFSHSPHFCGGQPRNNQKKIPVKSLISSPILPQRSSKHT